MTRSSQVGRTSNVTNALARPRDLGGCQVLCLTVPFMDVTDEPVLIGPISVTWAQDYQRLFVSASIAGTGSVDPDPDPDPDPVDWTVNFNRPGLAQEYETWTSGIYTVPNDGYQLHLAWSGAGLSGTANVIERKRGDGAWTPVVRPRSYPPGGTGKDFNGDPEDLDGYTWPGGHEYLAGDQLRCVMRTGRQLEGDTYEVQNDFTCTMTFRNFAGEPASSATIGNWVLSEQTTWTATFTYSAALVPEHGGPFSANYGAYGIYTKPFPGLSLNCRVTAVSWTSSSSDETFHSNLYISNASGMNGPFLVCEDSGASGTDLGVGIAVMMRAFNGLGTDGSDPAAAGIYVVTMIDDVETAGTDTTVAMDEPS